MTQSLCSYNMKIHRTSREEEKIHPYHPRIYTPRYTRLWEICSKKAR